MPVKLIAYYLPQYHPIPENDSWWGNGFTEWSNVVRAKPLFVGHYQPRLPADLGFYDLRVPEIREQQAALAASYNIDAFCYWHYWFKGKRLLNRPLDDMLKTGNPNFPFCLGWANESWTRTWEGDEKEILIKQEYSVEDDIAHARWLAQVFSDPRYLTCEGRPVFVIYRAPALPDPRRTLEMIKAVAVKAGTKEPYIIGRDTHYFGIDMRGYGCDITESTPAFGLLKNNIKTRIPDILQNLGNILNMRDMNIYDYRSACEYMEKFRPSFLHVPTVLTGWDNTARRGNKALILNNSDPIAFKQILKHNIRNVMKNKPEERLIFINAWNEWAEGMYLEPDQKWGYGYLEAIKDAKSEFFE